MFTRFFFLHRIETTVRVLAIRMSDNGMDGDDAFICRDYSAHLSPTLFYELWLFKLLDSFVGKHFFTGFDQSRLGCAAIYFATNFPNCR